MTRLVAVPLRFNERSFASSSDCACRASARLCCSAASLACASFAASPAPLDVCAAPSRLPSSSVISENALLIAAARRFSCCSISSCVSCVLRGPPLLGWSSSQHWLT